MYEIEWKIIILRCSFSRNETENLLTIAVLCDHNSPNGSNLKDESYNRSPQDGGECNSHP
jgi:hypothetical protein